MARVSFVELESESEWLRGLGVLRELRSDVTESVFLDRRPQLQAEGYRLFAATVAGEVVSLAGVSVQTNFFDGRRVYVYDLVTAAAHRSNGYGLALMEFVTEWGRENECEVVVLASGLERAAAHRFYEDRVGMERTDFLFKRPIE